MTEKRYKLSEPNGAYLIDGDRPYAHWINDDDKIIDLLNDIVNENDQLKQSVNNLKDTIIKITIAYQRKYDRTIVDLVDEVHEEDITDLIKELKND